MDAPGRENGAVSIELEERFTQSRQGAEEDQQGPSLDAIRFPELNSNEENTTVREPRLSVV